MGVCSVLGCERHATCRGWCPTHYGRWYRTGDPATRSIDLRDRVAGFWQLVDRRGPDDCWLWLGTILSTGYGQFEFSADGARHRWGAHRRSYELTHGEIGEGLCVLHRCDNPPCVNPAHLFTGTHADNVADMIAKGRNRPRVAPTHCKHGHEFTPANTARHGRNGRKCRACHRRRCAAYRRNER